ncbi:4'-phosphopantetheinyl transferase family protein [Arthrobacter sp. TmT3-37]
MTSPHEPLDTGAAPGGPTAGVLLRLQVGPGSHGPGRHGPGSGLPPVDVMAGLLDDTERARAARVVDTDVSGPFVAGRYLLRALAAELLGVEARRLTSSFTCPRCTPAGGSDHGRPGYLLDGERLPVALSLSRAGQVILLAGLDLRGSVRDPSAGIGVDLERVADVGFDGFDDVALTPAERCSLRGLSVPRRAAARARLWSRKEALVKALGTGFADRAPDEVDVLMDDRITDVLEVGGVLLGTLGLAAAVAVLPLPTG